MLRVLIADDSALAREMLATLINEDPEMIVAGVASGGRETVKKAQELRPDLITMDLLMPDMDGTEAIRHIMSTNPVPIVLVSSSVATALGPAHFDALALGAVDVVRKPDFNELLRYPGLRRKFLENLKAMSGVVIVKRRASDPANVLSKIPSVRARSDQVGAPRHAKVIALGASTGGPPAALMALSGLNLSTSPPVVFVQHMSPGFLEGFVDWLARETSLVARVAESGDRPGRSPRLTAEFTRRT